MAGGGWGLDVPCQATRDLVTQATLAFQDGEDQTPQAEAAKTDWASIARAFWAKSAEERGRGARGRRGGK